MATEPVADPQVQAATEILATEIDMEADHQIGLMVAQLGVYARPMTDDDRKTMMAGVSLGMAATMLVLQRHGMLKEPEQ